MANKLLAEKWENTLNYLEKAFAAEAFRVLGGFNYQPILSNPTLNRIAKTLIYALILMNWMLYFPDRLILSALR